QPRGVLRRTHSYARLPGRGGAARRPHPGREVRALEQGGQRGRHVQVRGRTQGPLYEPGRAGHERRGHRLLPHRRTLQPHLVRPPAPARLRQRAQLRRILDRMGQCRGRADRHRLRARRGAEPLMTAETTPETADLPEALAEVVTDFSETAADDRLQLLLEFASDLPELPEKYTDHPELREPVPECQSPIFLVTEVETPEAGGPRS